MKKKPAPRKVVLSIPSLSKRIILVVVAIVFFIVLITYLMLSIGINQFNASLIRSLRTGELPIENIPKQTSSKTDVAMPSQNVTKSNLPSDWFSKTMDKCGVTYSLPPKKEPYYYPYKSGFQFYNDPDSAGSGRYWDAPKCTLFPYFLMNISKGEWSDDDQANACYTNPEFVGSGYIPSSVGVACLKNNNNVSNNDLLRMVKQYVSDFNDIPNDALEKTTAMGPQKYIKILRVDEVKRWGYNVLDITYEYDQPSNIKNITMFASPDYIYQVAIVQDKIDPFLSEAAHSIFDNIVFE